MLPFRSTPRTTRSFKAGESLAGILPYMEDQNKFNACNFKPGQ